MRNQTLYTTKAMPARRRAPPMPPTMPPMTFFATWERLLLLLLPEPETRPGDDVEVGLSVPVTVALATEVETCPLDVTTIVVRVSCTTGEAEVVCTDAVVDEAEPPVVVDGAVEEGVVAVVVITPVVVVVVG